eukprot:113180_1
MLPKYEVRWFISLGGCLVCWLCCAPMIVFSLSRLNKISDRNEYLKRLPIIVNYLCKLGVVLFIFEKPLMYIAYISPLMYTAPEMQVILSRISRILCCVLSHGYIYLLTYRYWLLFYKLHLSKSLSHCKWKIHLNPHLHQQDFWLKYQKTYGSKKYCFIIFFIIYFIESMSLLIVYQIHLVAEHGFCIVQVIDACLKFFPLLFIIILKYKLPEFIDHCYIRDELKIISILLIIACLLYIVSLCISIIGYPMVARLISTSLSVLFYFSINIVLTLMIVIKVERNKTINLKHKPHSIQTYSTRSTHDSTHTYDAIDGSSPSDIALDIIDERYSKFTLPIILSNNKSFEIFVLFLIEEFSLEIILCWLELLQFKQQYKLKYLKYLNDNNQFDVYMFDVKYMNEFINIIFDETNMSYIVHSNIKEIKSNNKKQFISIGNKIIHILYDKYIILTSELVVTLSNEYRTELKQYIDHIDNNIDVKIDVNIDTDNDDELIQQIKKIYQLFDDVLGDIYLCLFQSYQRFVISDKFEKIKYELCTPNSVKTGCLTAHKQQEFE